MTISILTVDERITVEIKNGDLCSMVVGKAKAFPFWLIVKCLWKIFINK